jgi:histone deacetylase 1/2
MSSFHTDEYVHFLHSVTPETAEKMTYQGTRCMFFLNSIYHQILTLFFLSGYKVLVGEDNPAFEGVFEFCSISAGGSIGTMMIIARRLHF